MTGEMRGAPRRTNEAGEELPEDMNTLQGLLVSTQNRMILKIAGEIASTNTFINDLQIEFIEKLSYADYDADYMINELESWKPGSRQRVEDAINEVLARYDKQV